MTDGTDEKLTVKVPVDAPFEELVRAYERLWSIANSRKTGNVTLAVEDKRPDLALRLLDDFRHDAPGVLFTSSLSDRSVQQAPRETAEGHARRLVEALELMKWREPGSAPPPPPDPERLEATRRIADKARRLDPAKWPGWSTAERIVAALTSGRLDELPRSYRHAGEAWLRLDESERAVVREINAKMARYCKARADELD